MSINKDIYDEVHDKYIKEDKFIDKDICNEVHNEYIEDEKFVDKDMCDEINDKYIKENKFVDKDICDEIYDEYIEKDNISDKFPEDNHNNMEDYSKIEEAKISVNCKLKVDFDTKNKMIYLYPGKLQYFTVDVSKSCGDVTIKYKGHHSDRKSVV